MADFSLTTLFVAKTDSSLPLLPAGGSPETLAAGQIGIFVPVTGSSVSGIVSKTAAADVQAAPYFQIAQGRTNTYLQGTKKSDKISGVGNTGGKGSNVTEWYKVTGCPTAATQTTDVDGWNVKCGDIVTLTLRAHSSYIDTLYFNGFTRSVTVQAPCCNCGDNPCDTVDVPGLIDSFILKLQQKGPGINPDNISFSTFFQFQRIGNDANAILRISGKALTAYGQPCDVAAFPYEYDRMYFRTFVYSGPATTADFIVADNCNIVADATITQRASYPDGTSAEIAQMEKNYYSYQAGYLKHLYRMAGYNQNFESWVADGATYDTYYIKFNDYDRSAYQWGDYIHEDSMVIVAINKANLGLTSSAFETALSTALGTPAGGNTCITTTTSTTTVWPSTTTTSTKIP
jgi:hypothetical protein